MKLYLKCVSPVHIGTGKTLEPFDYVFYKENILILNQEICLTSIYDKHSGGIERYSQWVTETSRRISKAEEEFKQARREGDKKGRQHYNQLLSDLRRNFNLIYFCENHLKDPELASEFLRNPKYHRQSMFALSHPKGTRQLREIIQINDAPYLPGSSIKGAIRTALAFRAVKNLDDKGVTILLNGRSRSNIYGINRILEKIRRLSEQAIQVIQAGEYHKTSNVLSDLDRERRSWQKKIGDEVEKVVFGCGEEGKLGEKYDDPKFDLMRLIKVSDTTEGNWEMIAGHLMSYTRDGKSGGLKAQPIQLCEFIDANSTFQFNMAIDTALIQVIRQNRIKGWIGFKEKFQRLFGVDPSLPEDQLTREILDSILSAVKEFGKSIVDHEKRWLDNFSGMEVSNIRKFYENLNGNGNYLKIGFSSGWHATTVGLALAENPKLKEYLPELIYAFNLDLIINQEKLLKRAEKNRRKLEEQLRLLRRTPNVWRFPHSRRMIGENNKPLYPVGWIEISIQPFSKDQENIGTSSNVEIKSNDWNDESFEEMLIKLKEKFNNR